MLKPRTGHFNFQKDLAVAQVSEKRIADKLIDTLAGSELLHLNNDNRHDIAIKWMGKLYTFEYKEDFKSAQTGNVFIEFSCNGKKSGIQTTKATYYVLTISPKNGQMHDYIIPTSVIKQMIECREYFMTASGGDNGTAKGYLFKHLDIINATNCIKF